MGVILLLIIITFFIWRGAFFNFFAQDDFIFIKTFSQNNLSFDFINAFGEPKVTHFRPLHNLYFLTAGNIFEKNYYLYHLLTLVIHVTGAYFIYKIGQLLTDSRHAAIIGALFYATHPAHFVSLFWISGGATVIGFMFLVISFWNFLTKRYIFCALFLILALLASEAMLAGLVIFATWMILKKDARNLKFLTTIIFLGLLFSLVKFFFTSEATFSIYKVELSTGTLGALRYYLLRILGFAEISGDRLVSFLALLFWALTMFLGLEIFSKSPRQMLVPTVAIVSGFFPFILIPSHLSPHYMNISIWGLSLILVLIFKKIPKTFGLLAIIFLMAIAAVNISLINKNNWVIKRSNLAKSTLEGLRQINLPKGATVALNFDEYIALGQGEAINFFFAEKKYVPVLVQEDPKGTK